MAQMILTQVGAALGGPVGAQIGRTLGASLDKQLVQAILPGQPVGRRLTGLQLTATSEGAPVTLAFGRVRVGAQMIWAARFRERRVEQASGGGKSSALSAGGAPYRYAYSLSFAVGLCEGPIDGIGRIWADGKVLDTSHLTIRTYTGRADQTPDPLIQAVETDAPAYRGLAYLVFEDLALDAFGGRPPSLSVEIFRRVSRPGGPPAMEDRLRAVCLIPGAGESVYATTPVQRVASFGVTVTENVNTASGGADLLLALDQLQAQLPAVTAVSLVSSWFGDDLRCGLCRAQPGVETKTKTTLPSAWSAGGVGREGARLISTSGSGAAYGGTPSDASLVAAIGELKRRGLAVTLYPFLMMDIPASNSLPDPYGGARQAAYPWRGRITGTGDRTAAIRAQVASFFGAARVSDFQISGGQISGGAVRYTGADGWSYRRMILHHAALAVAAGGVDSFLIGSEMRGLTTLRDETGAYPAVAALVQLARDCRTLLGPSVKIGYAADWTEYFGHQPGDGSGDVFFHLDPMWSDPAISFVGVDWYAPVTDWRDGTGHLDAKAGFTGTADPAYLSARIMGGEGYDWFYASDAARITQVRTPITDGAYGEPWVFRPKDLSGWWLNRHYNRLTGVRSATPTGWVPGMKPIRLTEFGCAAIDRGANAPNRFLDPKSAESGLPPFSVGNRDDLGQRRLIEAVLARFSDPASNPVSPVYGGPMISPDAMAVWCWDARPFPEFPARESLWGDAPNWARGHWLTGRAGTGNLADLVASLLQHGGIDPASVDLSGATGLVQGFAVEGPARIIDTLSELALAYPFDLAERGGQIALVGRDAPAVLALDMSRMAISDAQSLSADPVTRLRGSRPAPDQFRVRFTDLQRDFQTGQVLARSNTPAGGGADAVDLPLALEPAQALSIGARRLRRRRAERDQAHVEVGLEVAHRLEPGDVVSLGADPTPWRVARVELNGTPRLILSGVETPDLPIAALPRFTVSNPAQPSGPPVLALLDLPPLPGAEDDIRPLLAVAGEPWRAVDVSAGPTVDALSLRASLTAPAPMGQTLTPLGPGPQFRLDLANHVDVHLSGLTLESLPLNAVLAGGNACAIQAANGEWELIQYLDAMLIGPDQWRLSRLLRAQGGSDLAMQAGAPTGASLVPLTPQLTRASVAQSERGLTLIWRAAPAGTRQSGSSSTDLSATWTGVALRPWSPCQLKARRLPGGDIALSWIRRARLHGDPLDGEPPLGEDSETWRVDISADSGVPIRSLLTATAQATYLRTSQQADFPGGLPRPLRFTVRQGSAVYGWGAPASTQLL